MFTAFDEKKRQPYVLVDFDHTLCDASRRDHMLGSGDWDAYHEDSVNDLPCTDVIELLHALKAAGFAIIGITARPAKFKNLTMRYAVSHGIPIDELLMRPDEAFRPSPAMKLELVEQRFGPDFPKMILFMLEDRDDVVAAFKARGVTMLQVHSRNYYITETKND